MVTFIRTRRTDNVELCRREVPDNWFTVYLSAARFEGRRIHWFNDKAYEIIYSEKDMTITMIKNEKPVAAGPSGKAD